jgi:transcription initiation factor TFIIA large subunit
MNKGFLESRSVLELYKDVVDDVIRNIRPLFEAEGIDEGVLTQLQELWETKLIQTGAIGGSPAADDSYFAPDAFSQGPAVPLYTGGTAPQAGAAVYNQVPTSDYNFSQPMGIQQRYLVQTREQFSSIQATAQSLPNMDLGMNPSAPIAQSSTQPGAQEVDRILGITSAPISQLMPHSSGDGMASLFEAPAAIPQTDGPGDDWASEPPAKFFKTEEGVAAPSTSAGVPFDPDFQAPTEEAEDTLNSDDDDDDIVNEDSGDASDLVLAQYDKVTRMKSKWKTTLKDGVMNIDGRDYIFKKASCEFDWA